MQPIDTVNILRGIKEKYESFHGVRISDRALVVAAELSHRYIQNRFLPDKAIDLVDEAASNMRVQLESKPEDIDTMQRALYRLQVEEQALQKEKDKVIYPLCIRNLLWTKTQAMRGAKICPHCQASSACRNTLKSERVSFSEYKRRGEGSRTGEVDKDHKFLS